MSLTTESLPVVIERPGVKVVSASVFPKDSIGVIDVGSSERLPIVVDAFIEIWSVDDVEHVGDAFYGHFDSVEDFVEDYLDQIGNELPSWVCVDYERTWDSALRFDFDFDETNGIMWCANW